MSPSPKQRRQQRICLLMPMIRVPFNSPMRKLIVELDVEEGGKDREETSGTGTASAEIQESELKPDPSSAQGRYCGFAAKSRRAVS